MSPVDALPKLPPAIARHTHFLLMEALPQPLTDAPEERAARDEAAIASLAALHPADAFEGRCLAARAVAADAQAMECMRLASAPRTEPARADRCRAQANAMMRASDAALRSLRAMQVARERVAAAAQQAPVPVAPPAPDVAAEADEFARRRPTDAALIRRLGGLPDDLAPISPDLVQAIVTGTSSALRALDLAADTAMPKAA